MAKRIKPFLIVIVVGVIFLVGYYLIPQRRDDISPALTLSENTYQLGDIIVDTHKGEIQFYAKVEKREGWVQHLVYLHGYKWLKSESAIVSSANLADLQKAIALLDWRLWDELWYGKKSKIKNQKSKMILFVEWHGKEIPAQELVVTEDRLGIDDYIFLGSPYFDHIALGTPHCVDCELCSIFPLEQKALREKFVRESGQSGYELNSEGMPVQGTEVNIIIRLLRKQRDGHLFSVR